MPDQVSIESPLAPFRKELKLYRGPDETDGRPTFNLYDPIRSKYFKINWEQSIIFQYFRGGMNAKEIAKIVSEHSTARLEDEDILAFFEGMGKAGLLDIPKTGDFLAAEAEKSKMNPVKWLLLHYLCIRIPLFRPDSFLSKTLPYVLPLASKTAFRIYALLTLIGIIGIIQNYQLYFGTFLYFFSLEGIIAFLAARVVAKCIHELAHAYTAKYFGIPVPTIGFLLIVLWPALYTDVTHGWTLRNRRKRLAITTAGVLSEVVIAGVTSFLWLITPEGILNSIFFFLSSSSWIISIFVNWNPGLRYDGYYLLADLWGIDNLQPRAFAMTKWVLRTSLLGMDLPMPENSTRRRRVAFVIYSIYTWIYRIFLYTAIALIVYHQFTKSLGVFLFFVEIILFFIWPLYTEIHEQYQLRSYMKKNPRLQVTVALFALLFLWVTLPLPHTIRFPAVTAPLDPQILYVPETSIIEKIYAEREASLKKGDPVVQLTSPWLNQKLKMAEKEASIAEKEIAILGLSDKTRIYIGQKESELASYRALVKQLQAEKSHLLIEAERDGTLFDWDVNLKVGQSVEKNLVLGKIADRNESKLLFFVKDSWISYLSEGDAVRFIISTPRRTFQGRIKRINPISSAAIAYPALAAHNLLPTNVNKKGAKELVGSYYEVEVEIESPSGEHPVKWGVVGEAEVTGRWYSILWNGFQSLSRLIWQESGA